MTAHVVLVDRRDERVEIAERALEILGRRLTDDTAALNTLVATAAGFGVPVVLEADSVVLVNAPVLLQNGTRLNLNGATALFLGLQAAGIAYAVKKVWNEKTFDYGNKAGFCIGSIFGVSKTVFNSADNGVVGIRTYRTNN